MINYIKEYCELPPLNRPQYDEDTDTYDIYFAEKMDGGNPYNLEQEMICLPFDTLEEAKEVLKQALELYEEKPVVTMDEIIEHRATERAEGN